MRSLEGTWQGKQTGPVAWRKGALKPGRSVARFNRSVTDPIQGRYA
jgi:hypothetical protein